MCASVVDDHVAPALTQGETMGNKAFRRAVVGFAAMTVLTSCAAGDESPAPTTVTATETVTAIATAIAPQQTPSVPEDEPAEETVEQTSGSDATIGEIGDTIENNGVSLTVAKARIVKSIEMNRTNYDSASSYARFTSEKPDKGGKFLEVQTVIENIGTVSMDLTCSFPIEITAVDTDERVFDVIDDLYSLRGNPDCNAKLQPGFTDKMTYVFLVPADVELTGLIFRDTTDFDSDFSVVRFTPHVN